MVERCCSCTRHSTCSTMGPSAWTTYRRNYTKPPVGVSPFLFCPPDGPAAVANCDTLPAIAWPYLLQSVITAGLLYQELTPLAHSRCPLARRRPHLNRGVRVCVCVYVCVCVTYILSSLCATVLLTSTKYFFFKFLKEKKNGDYVDLANDQALVKYHYFWSCQS